MINLLKALPVKRRLTALLFLILIILTIAFIWSNSLQNPYQSMQRSSIAEKAVKPVIMVIPIDSWHSPDMITFITRKLGHFSEFFILGIELMVLKLLLRPVITINLWLLVLLAVIIAAADECIQLTNGRGAMLQDVILDSSGALLGLGLPALVDKWRPLAFGRQ